LFHPMPMIAQLRGCSRRCRATGRGHRHWMFRSAGRLLAALSLRARIAGARSVQTTRTGTRQDSGDRSERARESAIRDGYGSAIGQVTQPRCAGQPCRIGPWPAAGASRPRGGCRARAGGTPVPLRAADSRIAETRPLPSPSSVLPPVVHGRSRDGRGQSGRSVNPFVAGGGQG